MLKKLFIVGLFTGSAHLFNLLALKFIALKVPNSIISGLGEVDSFVFILIAAVNFGIQLSATRSVAISNDWKAQYYRFQSARLASAMLLVGLCIMGFYNPIYFIFIIAPAIALNGDYVLYGRGLPKHGAFFSFLRVSLSAATLIVFSYVYTSYLVPAFVVSIFLGQMMSGMATAHTIKANYWIKPIFKNLDLYRKHANIGFSTIAHTIIGVGIISIASYIYSDDSIAIIFLMLKLYLVFRGVKQIISQSFFKDLQEAHMGLKVDSIAICAGFLFFISFGFFSEIVAQIFFEKSFAQYSLSFLILGIAGFISSFSTTVGAVLLLNNKDRNFAFNMISAGLVTIVTVFIFYQLIGDTSVSIALSILMGEITLTLLESITVDEKSFWLSRLKNTWIYLIIVLFIVIAQNFIPIYWVFSIAIIAYAIITLYIFKKINVLSIS